MNSRPRAAATCSQAPPVALVRSQGLKAPQPRCRRWPLDCGLPSARPVLACLIFFSKLSVEPGRRWYAEAAGLIQYPMWRKRFGAAVGKAPKKELLSFKQPIFDLLQPSLVGQLLPAPRLNAFIFDAPRRTGTVLGSVAAQLPYHVVAVLDLRRVMKAPPKQSALFHAALIRV